jgi:hypothetical protein
MQKNTVLCCVIGWNYILTLSLFSFLQAAEMWEQAWAYLDYILPIKELFSISIVMLLARFHAYKITIIAITAFLAKAALGFYVHFEYIDYQNGVINHTTAYDLQPVLIQCLDTVLALVMLMALYAGQTWNVLNGLRNVGTRAFYYAVNRSAVRCFGASRDSGHHLRDRSDRCDLEER